MGSFKDYDNMTEEEKAFYIAQMNAEANNMSDLDYRKHKQLLIDEFGTSGVTPGNRAGVDTAAIAAEEERKRRLALLQKEQIRASLNPSTLFGKDADYVSPLEIADNLVGDEVEDLVTRLGLPPESLLALGLITRNGRVTQRGFKALVKRVGGNNVVKPRIKMKNKTATSNNVVKPRIKLKNNTKNVDEFVGPRPTYKSIMNRGTSSEAKNNMLQNLMTNMKNNKGRWGTGAVIAGSVANNQLSSDNSDGPDFSFVDPPVVEQENVITPVHDVNYSKKLAEQYWKMFYEQGEAAANEFIGAHINDDPNAIAAVMNDNSPFITKEDDELERLMKEAEKMESRLGEGTRVDNPYKKTEDKIKPKELSWMDRLMQGVPGGSGGWDNPMYRIGELMREMDAPGSWGLDGKASNRWSTAAAAEAKAMNSAQTASNKQREAQFKRLWDEASKNPKNFALMVRGYLPDDSPWWQLWGEMSEENKESYAMALAITANEIQQDYLTEKGKLASNESVMAEAIKRTKKPTA